MNPGRVPALCTTSTSCASTAATPITDRSRHNESCSAAEFFHASASVASRSGYHHFLFCAGAWYWSLPEGPSQYGRRVLHVQTRGHGLGSTASIPIITHEIARSDELVTQ